MSLLTSLQVMEHPKSTFKIGDTITEENKPGGKVFIMLKGAVEVSLNGQVIATQVSPGEIFGEIATICGCNYSATVTVVEESEFFVIDNFLTYLKQNPDDSITVQRSSLTGILMTDQSG